MLARCNQKEKVNGLLSVSDWWNSGAQNQLYSLNRSNPYFKEIKQGYGKTRYYQQAVEECSYLRDFIAVKR